VVGDVEQPPIDHLRFDPMRQLACGPITPISETVQGCVEVVEQPYDPFQPLADFTDFDRRKCFQPSEWGVY
jgi:hypothetical protein